MHQTVQVLDYIIIVRQRNIQNSRQPKYSKNRRNYKSNCLTIFSFTAIDMIRSNMNASDILIVRKLLLYFVGCYSRYSMCLLNHLVRNFARHSVYNIFVRNDCQWISYCMYSLSCMVRRTYLWVLFILIIKIGNKILDFFFYLRVSYST